MRHEKVVRTIIALLALAAVGVAQEAPPDEKAERLRRALEWIQDPDPDVRAIGRKELTALGPDAVPKLEEILKAKGVLEIVQVLRDLEGAKAPSGDDPHRLQSDGDLFRSAPKPDASATEKYVWGKFLEAHKLAKGSQFQKAYDMASALLTLEPRSSYADQIHQLRKYADNMITQTSLVRTQVLGPDGAGVSGAKVPLKLRMENSWKSALEVAVDKGKGDKPTRAIVVLEIVCERHEPNGTVTRLTRSDEVEIPHDIPIALGAQWEQAFELDTSVEFSEDKDCIRTYTVGGFAPLVRIDWGLAVSQKRLWFQPATVKVVPEKHAHLAEDPAGKLAKVIEAGTINEVFVCMKLLNDAQRPAGVEQMVALMEKFAEKGKKAATEAERAEATKGLIFAANILSAVTGQKLGTDVKKWREYSEQLKSEQRPR